MCFFRTLFFEHFFVFLKTTHFAHFPIDYQIYFETDFQPDDQIKLSPLSIPPFVLGYHFDQIGMVSTKKVIIVQSP